MFKQSHEPVKGKMKTMRVPKPLKLFYVSINVPYGFYGYVVEAENSFKAIDMTKKVIPYGHHEATEIARNGNPGIIIGGGSEE